MSYLYLIQNDTHMKNFKKLMRVGDMYIDIGRLTGQTLINKEQLPGQEISLPIPKLNFFSLSATKRLFFLFKHQNKIKAVLSRFKFEKIIIGNDGAIQKLIIENLINKKNIHVDMWLDGLISLNSSRITNIVKIVSSKLFEAFNIPFIMPSVIGFYNKINVIYVMHESVLAEYKKFKLLINIKKIQPIIFPRHNELLKMKNKINSKKTIILYLTSAWEFHGKTIEQENQRAQIIKLVDSLGQNSDVSFRIRIHPRDNDEIYLHSNITPFLSGYSNFEDDIINSHIVISARSTGLLEAEMINKKVIIYNLGFGNKYLNSYTQNLDKCDSITDLLLLIKNH